MTKTLFKYTSVQFVQSSIENGVYASRVDQVNDPYEGNGIENPHLFRIACLTNASSAMLMWAYYGNHHGCRIEYDVSSIPKSVLHEVEYIKEFQDHYDMTPIKIVQSLYKKGNEWAHEKESRAVYYEPESNTSLWFEKDNNVFLRAKVVSVAFGILAGEGLEAKDYLEALLYLKQHPEIEVKKAKLRRDTYAITFSSQFDMDEEIKRIQQKLSSLRTVSTERETHIRDRLHRWIDTSSINKLDRVLLFHEPWRKFQANDWIIRNSNIEIPEYGNGIIKVEPYDLDDFEVRVLLGGATIEVKGQICHAYEIGCITYANIDEVLDHGTKNYPYPTIICKWENTPFSRIIYIDEGTKKEYSKSEVSIISK